MANRKPMSESAKKFLQTGEIEPITVPNSGQVETAESESEAVPEMNSLRSELLGDELLSEPTVRFTVDLPKSLHRRLDQLSTDSGKPKTELVRIMIRRSLENINY